MHAKHQTDATVAARATFPKNLPFWYLDGKPDLDDEAQKSSTTKSLLQEKTCKNQLSWLLKPVPLVVRLHWTDLFSMTSMFCKSP